MIFRYHLFKKSLPLMNRALDAYSLRQRTTSKNIANVNSPHYRPENVRFEEYFHKQEEVLKGSRSEAHHIPLGRPDISSVEGEVGDAPVPRPEIYFSGETHVNIDKEMSEMAKNQIRFRFASLRVNSTFKRMSSSIFGTRE
ncbi:MAG: flagellar basal body rod protein FlgB [Bacteroidota bacterium]